MVFLSFSLHAAPLQGNAYLFSQCERQLHSIGAGDQMNLWEGHMRLGRRRAHVMSQQLGSCASSFCGRFEVHSGERDRQHCRKQHQQRCDRRGLWRPLSRPGGPFIAACCSAGLKGLRVSMETVLGFASLSAVTLRFPRIEACSSARPTVATRHEMGFTAFHG